MNLPPAPSGSPATGEATAALGERPGDLVGHYRLLERLGEGGCGIVYRAEQREPVRREVALKIIKLGMDSKAVIARFEAERQALALMDHPGIARVFDAGATDTGRPYFVMELVRGVRVTEYCDQCALPVAARLRLFMAICHAVQHAHQKGVIHRDLKPSNVLVVPHDEAPEPKVIDFGIAKALPHLGERLTDATVFTAYEQFIGTPAYMSPEQAGHSNLDLDTRTDLYSLGVLLYELLAGRTPFDAEELKRAGADGMRRIVREREPLRPSARFAALHPAEQDATARRRGVEPAALASALRGDLDWVAMRCLEKDRARRYASASELAADVQRHLDSEPVSARRPSTAYRLQKYVRRHRTGVAALAAVFLALVAGLALALVSSRRAVAAQREAETQRALSVAAQRTAEEQRRAALGALAEAETVTEFFIGAVAAADPTRSGKDTTIRQLLEQAGPAVDAQFRDRPALQARLLTTIGETFFSLGQYGPAKEHLARALPLRETHLPKDDPLTLRTRTSLAEVFTMTNEPAEAVALARTVVAVQQSNPATPPREAVRARTILSMGLFMSGQFEQAAATGRELLVLCRRTFGDDHPETLQTTMNLGFQLWAVEDYAGSIEHCRAVIGSAALPPLHPFREMSRHAAAISAEELGDYVLAQEFESAAAPGLAKLLGEEHFHTLTARFVFECCKLRAGGPASGFETVAQIRAAEQRLLPPGHPNLHMLDAHFADLLARHGRSAEALALGEQSIAGFRASFGAAPLTFRTEAEVASYETQAGRPADAERRARRLLAELGALPRRYEYSFSRAHLALAAALSAQRRFDEAEQVLLANHAMLEALTLDVRQQRERTVAALVALFEDSGRPERAAEWRVRGGPAPVSP